MIDIPRVGWITGSGDAPVILAADGWTVRRLLLVTVLLAAACSAHPAKAAATTLTLWSHGGTTGEQAALGQIVRSFEDAHPDVTVKVEVTPEGEYDDHLQAGIAAGHLPDVIDVDGPLVATYASQDALAPLDGVLPAGVLKDLLPTLRTQGTWRGHLWALGTFESGLGLWGDRRALQAAGVRIPTGVSDAWSSAETTAALKALAAHDPDGKVLDLKEDYGVGEWLTYGFAPLVASAGGDLLHLDAAPARTALSAIGSWAGYVDPDADGKAFVQRRVALSWVGHWAYPDYAKALGSDLVLLPLPDLGHGSRTGEGSWAWSIARSSTHQRAAAQLLTWLDQDRSIATMTAANGAVPGTSSALAVSALHGPAGALHLFREQLQAGVAVPRPVTPDYPRITAAFATAVRAVLDGTSPATALQAAAASVAAP